MRRRPYRITTLHSGQGAQLTVWIDGPLTIEDGRLLARDLIVACHRADDVQTSITRRHPDRMAPGPEDSAGV